MTPLYSVAQIRTLEQHAASQHINLMAQAAAAIVDWVQARFPHPCRLLAVCGSGNNGGDTVMAALALHQLGYAVTVFMPPPPHTEEVKQAFTAWCNSNLPIAQDPAVLTHDYALILDGLFGIGLSRPLGAEMVNLITTINQHPSPRLAIDTPSGLDVERGIAWPVAIHADDTLSFISHKLGHWIGDGPDHVGRLTLAPLSIPSSWLPQSDTQLTDAAACPWSSLRRAHNSHKGRYGSVAILGGSDGMVGAALLAAHAALYCGAGKVYVGALAKHPPSVDLTRPELMWRSVASLLADDSISVFAAGPGWGSEHRAELTRVLRCSQPLLLDADALNQLANSTELATLATQRTAPLILTPHPGEAARLLGTSITEVQQDRVDAAHAIAARYQAICVLKGCGTLICDPHGRMQVNPSGNPGQASAGQGDVLSGTISALLAQGFEPFTAAYCGVYLHGYAADVCVTQGLGPLGLTALETAQHLRNVLNQFCR